MAEKQGTRSKNGEDPMTDDTNDDLFPFEDVEAHHAESTRVVRQEMREALYEELEAWVEQWDNCGPDDKITVLLNVAAQMVATQCHGGTAELEERLKKIGSEFPDVVLKYRSEMKDR